MKYLKYFENLHTQDSVEKFCKDNLAYLIDDGAIIDCESGQLEQLFVGILNINKTWSDIEADILPFLEIINMNFELIPFNLRNINSSEIKKNVNVAIGIFNDDIEDYIYPYFLLDDILNNNIYGQDLTKGKIDEVTITDNTIIERIYFFIKNN